MKQKTITTDKATLLVVELPEGSKNVRVNNARGIFGYTDKINIVRWEALEFGNWQLLGRLPDITEEQWKGVVDYFTTDEEFGKEDVFRDYLDKSFFDTATESGVSLLQANEVYFENTTPHPSEIFTREYDETNFFHRLANKKWQEAQSKVFDKERTFLFIKVD